MIEVFRIRIRKIGHVFEDSLILLLLLLFFFKVGWGPPLQPLVGGLRQPPTYASMLRPPLMQVMWPSNTMYGVSMNLTVYVSTDTSFLYFLYRFSSTNIVMWYCEYADLHGLITVSCHAANHSNHESAS